MLVQRAFENLFSNAIRYTKDNDSIFLNAYILQEKNEIIFEIKDTGIGIKKEGRFKQRLFMSSNSLSCSCFLSFIKVETSFSNREINGRSNATTINLNTVFNKAMFTLLRGVLMKEKCTKAFIE